MSKLLHCICSVLERLDNQFRRIGAVPDRARAWDTDRAAAIQPDVQDQRRRSCEDDSTVAYLRPETAQGIFVNFKNVLDSTRLKMPFGIAQVGKAFRNEINPRNYTFRCREFEQMEIEFFCHPDESMKWYQYLARHAHEAGTRARHPVRQAPAARARQGRARPLFHRHHRHRVPVPVLRRAAGAGRRRPPRRLRPQAAQPSTAART